jgi:hypothetical protein
MEREHDSEDFALDTSEGYESDATEHTGEQEAVDALTALGIPRGRAVAMVLS